MRKLLYDGAELFMNRQGDLWVIDIFPALWPDHSPVLRGGPYPTPSYHAVYDNEYDAMQDFVMWREWPDEDTVEET